MDLNGLQNHRNLIYPTCSPAVSGLAQESVPSAFPVFFPVRAALDAPSVSLFALPFSAAWLLPSAANASLRFARRLRRCHVFRRAAPVMNSVSAAATRPLNDPLARIFAVL